MSEVAKLIHRDISELRYCNKGARQFFERHGLDWSLFISEGIDLSVFEQMDDEMVRAAVTHAKQRLGIE